MSKWKKNNRKNKLGKLFGLCSLGRERSKISAIETCVPTVQNIKDKRSNHDTFLPSSKAMIYASEIDYIAKCIQDYPNIETGGQLYGAWTASGVPRVIYAIGPGPMANHQSAFFNQDIAYLETIGAKLKQYGLQHIGEWHSHHHLGIPRPSRHDVSTMQNGINQLNLNRFMLCIGSFNRCDEIVINPFNFTRDAQYIEANWEVINTPNRLRQVIDEDLKAILSHPHSSNYTLSEPNIQINENCILDKSTWFSKKENRMALKQIIDKLKTHKWIVDVAPQINDNGKVTLKVRSNSFEEIITFPEDFPNTPFTIKHTNLIEGDWDIDIPQNWETIEDDLYKIFISNYYNHLHKFSK